MLSRQDVTTVAEILRAAARAEIMPRFRRLSPDAIRSKTSKLDLVTDADEAAEAMIASALRTRFPGCLVVGEEATAANPALPGALAAAPLAFTVDPIDGTANFAAGLPLFGVMAAMIEDGETKGAVILDPVVDSFSAAFLGQGAWEHAADGTVTPLRAAGPAPLAAMMGPISWRFMDQARKTGVLARLPRVATTWDHRCAAHEYRALAAGHAHFVVFNRLMPWDHLPGCLLHSEAGGYAAKFDGTPYRPGETEGGLICAPDQASWRALYEGVIAGQDGSQS